jgi:general secretion pathway protein I
VKQGRPSGRVRPPCNARRCTLSRHPLQSGHGGFTLVEILVALTIVAIALMASLRAVGSLTNSASDLRARTLAQWSAENRLSQIRVQREYPAVGRRSFDCAQGDLPLRCQEDVYATPNPNFRRVEIQVFDPAQMTQTVGGTATGGRLARLLGFATNLQ